MALLTQGLLRCILPAKQQGVHAVRLVLRPGSIDGHGLRAASFAATNPCERPRRSSAHTVCAQDNRQWDRLRGLPEHAIADALRDIEASLIQRKRQLSTKDYHRLITEHSNIAPHG
jgi:hypothetical protein